MMEINRSCTPAQVASMRQIFEKQGLVEAKTREEAEQIEADGRMAFIDHTKGGEACFSPAEMEDFRRTDCTVPGAFEAHLRRFGHLREQDSKVE